VRLLMRGVPSTNVMTTNTTQIAIDAAQAGLTWGLRRGGDPEMARQHEVARRRLAASVPLPVAFFAGTVIGALAYAAAGPWVLALPTAAAGSLTLWAAWGRGRGGP